MNRNTSILVNLIAALSIVALMGRQANACLSTQLQDYRAHAKPQGNCIELTNCLFGAVIEEIKVCLDACPSNTAVQANLTWFYNRCICSLARISSDFRICSDKCPDSQVAQQDSMLCLTTISQCSVFLSQDRTMCGLNECPLVDMRVSPNVCLSQLEDCKDGFISIDEKSCLSICPYQQYSTETALIQKEVQYKKCVNKMKDIVVISLGFALIATLSSFLFCQGIITAKIVRQEKKYLRDLFPATTEEDDDIAV